MEQAELQWVNIENLKPHPQNPRIFVHNEVVEGIANEIRQRGEFGQEHAILVRSNNNGLEVVAGHHRIAGAQQAGLEKIPAWVQNMSDDEAYMFLLQDNNQKELAPLEIGLHALKSNKSLRDYGEKTGFSYSYIRQLINAALVYGFVCSSAQLYGVCSSAQFLDKTRHLSEIYVAPQEAWMPLVEYLLKQNNISVSKIRNKTKITKDLAQSIPEWWSINKSNTFSIAINNETKCKQLIKMFNETNKITNNFDIVQLYSKKTTDVIVEFDGRKYYKVIPEQFEYDQRSDFIEKVKSLEGLPKINQIRSIANDIQKYSNQHLSDEIEYTPVLTDKEVQQAEAERKRQQQIELENTELLKLKHDNCLTYLKFWQRKSIDLLLTDPPYGIEFQSNRRTVSDKIDKIENDALNKALELLDSMLKHAIPNMSDNSIAIIWYDIKHQADFENIIQKNGLAIKEYLTWHKPNHGPGDLNLPAPNDEHAFFCTKGDPIINKRINRCIKTEHEENHTDHPTEKPLSLLKTWIEAFTNETDLVVDPFMGTGSSIIAAYSLDRDVWAAEINEDFYEQAKERFLKLYRTKQQKMIK